jgi:predicted NUDIX family NTP pyrophosphohydrolase
VNVRSAGILLWRDRGTRREVWIAHMGGPYWTRKDERAWSIPKGEFDPDGDPLAAALREFAEEMGVPAPVLDYVELGEYRYSSGKTLTVFAADGGSFEVAGIQSNRFELEWPPGSGRRQSFPEVDRAEWVDVALARRRLVAGQVPMLDDLPAPASAGA